MSFPERFISMILDLPWGLHPEYPSFWTQKVGARWELGSSPREQGQDRREQPEAVPEDIPGWILGLFLMEWGMGVPIPGGI